MLKTERLENKPNDVTSFVFSLNFFKEMISYFEDESPKSKKQFRKT